MGDPGTADARGDKQCVRLGPRLHLRLHPALQVDGQRNLEGDDDGNEDVGEGDDQAGTELRGPSYPVLVSSLDTSPVEAKRNPTPRTVVMYRGRAGSSSSFLRSQEM
jgi:hypothetical protein